jgi:hypothetical protein
MPVKVGDKTYPAGSYVIKRDQPYGRLAKNLLEKQDYPDARLQHLRRQRLEHGLRVGRRRGAGGLGVHSRRRDTVVTCVPGTLAGHGTAAIAVAHLGSNNMITLRYLLRTVPMRWPKRASPTGGRIPAGSFIIDMAAADRVRPLVDSLGLTARCCTAPRVATHDADVPRVAIYSQWSGTQNSAGIASRSTSSACRST